MIHHSREVVSCASAGDRNRRQKSIQLDRPPVGLHHAERDGYVPGANGASGGNTIVRSTFVGNGVRDSIAVGNDVGPLDSAATATSSRANIETVIPPT